MINQFGPESHGGHLGVARVLAKLWFARERLRKFWGLMVAQRRDQKEDRVSCKPQLCTSRGQPWRCGEEVPGSQWGISCEQPKLVMQEGAGNTGRKFWLGIVTTLGLHLECPITIQLGNDWSFGRPVIISHLDNCTSSPVGPHLSRGCIPYMVTIVISPKCCFDPVTHLGETAAASLSP